MENGAESTPQNQSETGAQGPEDSVSEATTEEDLEEIELKSYITNDLHIVPEIVSGIHSADREVRLAATVKVRRVMRELKELARQPLINSRLIEPVVGMLSFDDLELCAEAAWILINFTVDSLSPSTMNVVVAAGAIPKLIALLPCQSTDVMENAVWALANIARQSQHVRDVVVQSGGVKPVLDILDTPEKYELKVVNIAVRALGSYLSSKWDQKLGYEVTRHMIPVLVRYIKSTANENHESLVDVLRSLDRISANKTAVEAIITTGITPRLVELCATGNDNLRPRAIYCLGQFTSHGEPSIEAPIQAGFLTALKSCINSEHDYTRLSACWATWNIAKVSSTHAQALFDDDLVAPIFKIISNQDEGTRTRQNAVWLLLKLTEKAKEHNELFVKLVQANCMEAFAAGLLTSDYSTLSNLIEGLENVTYTQWSGREDALERFKVAGGVARLVTLRDQPRTRGTLVGRRALGLIRYHFQEFSKRPRV
ncbi:Importin subunit alpha-4 [Tulasnella sp. UAMH 9824]|nr:Importin subunit alpha-4 [Tulasnella sp. UAMH 9824]